MKLRKVKYAYDYNQELTYNGYFHKWVEVINGKYGELPEALIEKENGEMTSVKYLCLKFIDKPED